MVVISWRNGLKRVELFKETVSITTQLRPKSMAIGTIGLSIRWIALCLTQGAIIYIRGMVISGLCESSGVNASVEHILRHFMQLRDLNMSKMTAKDSLLSSAVIYNEEII